MPLRPPRPAHLPWRPVSASTHLLLAAALACTPLAAAAAATGQSSPTRNGQPAAKTPGKPHRPAAAHARKPATPVNSGTPYGQRADAMALADALAERHGLDPAWTRAQLAQARHLPVVARLIMPPPAGTAKNWAAYRARFIEPERIRAGAAFWEAHQRWLDAAHARYGVPPAIVVGIIGVETFYGRITGNFRVLDALATLSLDFPSGRTDRSPFFRDELGEFLKLVQAERLPTTEIKGSFAGAIGLGQFMPGSINRHAVDFDGDGHIDMAGSAADVIGSVAHYLVNHGWQRDMPTHFAIRPPVATADRAALLAPDILPSFSPAQLAGHGAELDAAGQAHPGLLALVELQNGEAAPSYVAGSANFYAVTRYNWSAYYAMAVIALGEAVGLGRSSKP